MVLLENNFANVRFQNLITIGAKYMAVMDGSGITAADNLNVEGHPFWSQVTLLDVGSNGTTNFNELVWIDPKLWDMESPSFTCLPPCNIKLPPYTATTRTVNYPLMTVSDGTWTSTITKAPLTISEWVLEIVTITADGGSSNPSKNKVKKRAAQGFSEFTPVPATTPFWPSVVYEGMNGQLTTTAPSVAFPTPPAGLVQRGVMPIQGSLDNPYVNMCGFWDPTCANQPWLYGDTGTGTAQSGDSSDPGDDDENAEDLQYTCAGTTPAGALITSSSSSSSTSTTTTSTTSKLPEPSPYETGDPEDNKVSCYNSGETTENARMQNAAASFCNEIKPAGSNLVLGPGYFSGAKPFDFPYNGGIGFVQIIISLNIKANCQWTWNLGECERYLGVPTNACDCSALDNKRGGSVDNNCYSWRIDPNRAFN